MTIKMVTLRWPAGLLSLPATGFAEDSIPGRRSLGHGSVVRDYSWYETERRDDWHPHRVPCRQGSGFDGSRRWHLAARFDRHGNRRHSPLWRHGG